MSPSCRTHEVEFRRESEPQVPVGPFRGIAGVAGHYAAVNDTQEKSASLCSGPQLRVTLVIIKKDKTSKSRHLYRSIIEGTSVI
jgi:hypothetical protein